MGDVDLAPTKVEHRWKPRINCSYPAIMQGWDICGRKFRTGATVINMSATGLCLHFLSGIQPGSVLFVVFRCSSTTPLGVGKAPLIAVHGNVVRSVTFAQGMHEIVVKIHNNRFL